MEPNDDDYDDQDDVGADPDVDLSDVDDHLLLGDK